MEYFWKKKDWLAYGLAVLVFTLHLSSVYQYGQITSDEGYLYPYKIFKMCVSRVAVPSFFILSSAIFFRDFSIWGGYFKKIRSRFNSLIIPYLSWNTVYLVFSIFATLFLSKYFIEREPMQITVPECLKAIFLFKQNGHFWFIFDLIVFFVLSPLFYFLLKNKVFGIISILAIVIPLVCIIPETSVPSSIFYLMLGAYLGIHHFQWFTSSSKKKTRIGIVGVIICILLLFFINDHDVLRFPVLSVYSLCLLFAIDIFKDGIMLREVPVFIKHSFWVYALHGIVGSVMAKSFYLLLPKNVAFAYPNFVLSLVISLIIIECTALMCKRFLPRIYPLFSGGRD